MPGRLELCLGNRCSIGKVLESVRVVHARNGGAVPSIRQGLNVCVCWTEEGLWREAWETCLVSYFVVLPLVMGETVATAKILAVWRLRV